MSKKKRKPTSKAARRARFINRWLPGLILTARASNGLDRDGEATLTVSHRSGPLGDLAHAHLEHEIVHWQHHWQVTVFVECETPDGEKYRDDIEFEARGVRINDLAPLVQPELEKIQHQANPNHYRDHGWQAEILPVRKQERSAA